MKVLLLLAGQSTRFWPLADKSFFPICGKTVLHHQLDCLRAAGLRDILLVGGKHNKKKIQEIFPQLPFIEQKNLAIGMQGALLSSLPHIKKGPVMVVSGNDIIEPSGYKILMASASKNGVDGAILAKKVDRYFPGGYLLCHPELNFSHHDMRISGIVEKPGDGNEPSDLVNIVAHVHSDPVPLLHILKNPSSPRDDGYERALSTLFKEQTYIAAPYKGYWQPIKYPWHLLDILAKKLQEIPSVYIHKTAHIHQSAVIEGNVVIEQHVQVLPHASIIGPCTIGRGTIVATGALVRQSSIEEGCVVGFGTEIARSVLGRLVKTHKNYIGDSVIGENVAFGAGGVTGNFRLDEGVIHSMVKGQRCSTLREKCGTVIGDNSRIGIQVGINPGVKIGGGTFVSGGGFVMEDVEDNAFVSWNEGRMIVTKNRFAL